MMSDDPMAGGTAGDFAERFVKEGQDIDQVRKTLDRVTPVLTRGEEVLYIAIQKKLASPLAPESVVLTNRRFFRFQARMLGRTRFDDWNWRDLSDVKMEEKMLGASLAFITTNGEGALVENLHKEQARKAYSLSREMQDRALEERRARMLEEQRAKAGQINVGTPGLQVPRTADGRAPLSSPADELAAELSKLKRLHDEGLLTRDEYETKRKAALERF